MLMRVSSVAIISMFSVSVAFADELVVKSDMDDNAKLSNTYTLVKVSKGNEKSSDGKLLITSIKRSRVKSHRHGAYVYEGWDKVTLDGHTYKVHFVSITEKDGTAKGVWKAFDQSEKLVDEGKYTYKSDKHPEKAGKL